MRSQRRPRARDRRSPCSDAVAGEPGTPLTRMALPSCFVDSATRGGDCVCAGFDRDVGESIGSALPIRREVPVVVTEGNIC